LQADLQWLFHRQHVAGFQDIGVLYLLYGHPCDAG
jgi:hypothetical protein